MIISDKYSFIFFEMGKTGTSSIKTALQPYGMMESHEASPFFDFTDNERFIYQKHIPPAVAQERLGEVAFRRYFRFAFVRNPFDRLVSRYFYSGAAEIDKKNGAKNNIMTMEMVELLCQYPRLQLVLKGLSKDKQTQYRGLTWLRNYTQSGFLSDREGNLLVDYVGRFDRLQQDFDQVCRRIGIPHITLPWLNKTSHIHYSNYYTKETRLYVADMYEEDLENFGYKF